MSVQTDIAI